MYTHINTHTHTYTHTHSHIHTYICIHIDVHSHKKHTHTCTHTYTHTHIYIRTHTYNNVDLHVKYLYSCPILVTLEFSRQLLEKTLKNQVKCKSVRWQPSGSMLTEGRTHRQA